MNIRHKPLEIFCGTGGVGKTTLASSRAIFLAKQNLKVLLVTIDPSKRLKQVLSLKDELAGEVNSVELDFDGTKIHLDALLMSPDKTIERMANESGYPEAHKNRIVKILTKPYGGMNEILAIIEVEHQLSKNHYDVIVLDTPPGGHFIDFLESMHKIQSFFDQSFIEIFKHLGKKINLKEKPGFNLFSMVVTSGVKKLLSYLESVTGKNFIEEFVEAIGCIYSMRSSFTKGVDLEERMDKKEFSNWFLVTAVDHQKLNEAKEIKDQAFRYLHEDSYIILNKCTEKHWDQTTVLGPLGEKIKSSMIDREKHLKNNAKKDFKHIIEFSEVLSLSPLSQIKELMRGWETV